MRVFANANVLDHYEKNLNDSKVKFYATKVKKESREEFYINKLLCISVALFVVLLIQLISLFSYEFFLLNSNQFLLKLVVITFDCGLSAIVLKVVYSLYKQRDNELINLASKKDNN